MKLIKYGLFVLALSVKANIDDLSANITIRQHRRQCRCINCDGQIYGVKQWRKKTLWGIPMGIFQRVKIIFYRPRTNKPYFISFKKYHPA